MRALLTVVSLAAALTASAAVPAPPELPGQEIEVKAADGWALKAKYEPAQPGKRTMILLHARGQRREAWVRLARALKRVGFGYFAPDLRGHGRSATAPDGSALPWNKFKMTKEQNDYAQMTLDVQASMAFLAERGIPEDSIGLIGDALGGSIALKYAAVHPQVPLVVMLSPGLSYQEVTTVNAMRAYKDRPILMMYGELDKNSSASTPILYNFAKQGAGERNATMISVPATHGVRLLNGVRARQIVAWLDNPVKPEVAAEPAQAAEPATPDAAEDAD